VLVKPVEPHVPRGLLLNQRRDWSGLQYAPQREPLRRGEDCRTDGAGFKAGRYAVAARGPGAGCGTEGRKRN
jgi:hypothetical protein